ncbi:hypothetical protein B0T26DRAFT_292375 [Lasiosphaeria miniovina]|uniref:Uncharacterized protein n=1 Tax=Lasiosphaeria miniovina TaxID=1954250 RepID=A0AA40AK45_9PEZI|nr:uncharacterized protein B0T26DRAFT_292375 [Lasiosphaeria miniovina]KAK0717265.1 hypothetical protein B0T26DRAFT_292375 [Lasiosphaeria miniovina]
MDRHGRNCWVQYSRPGGYYYPGAGPAYYTPTRQHRRRHSYPVQTIPIPAPVAVPVPYLTYPLPLAYPMQPTRSLPPLAITGPIPAPIPPPTMNVLVTRPPPCQLVYVQPAPYPVPVVYRPPPPRHRPRKMTPATRRLPAPPPASTANEIAAVKLAKDMAEQLAEMKSSTSSPPPTTATRSAADAASERKQWEKMETLADHTAAVQSAAKAARERGESALKENDWTLQLNDLTIAGDPKQRLGSLRDGLFGP